MNILDYQKNEGHIYNNVSDTEIRVPFNNSGFAASNSEEKADSPLNLRENQVELSTPCNDEPSRIDSLPLERTHDVPSVCGDKEMLKEEIPAVLLSLTAYQPSTDTTVASGKTKLCNLASPSSESVGNNISKQSLGRDRSSKNHSWGKRVVSYITFANLLLNIRIFKCFK